MQGIIRAVHVGGIETIPFRGRNYRTAICKKPCAGQVQVRRLGLEGDDQADKRYHGGEDKAVYAYPSEHYDPWRLFLGRDELELGAFGENLLLEGLLETEVHIGDCFRAGTALLEITQPRVPCNTLARRMGTTRVVKEMLRTGRCGFYLRVLEEGALQTHDSIQRITTDPARVSVADIYHLRHFDPGNSELRERALSVAALSASWREALSRL